MENSREKIRRLMIAINQIDELYYNILRTLKMKDGAFVLFYAIADSKPYSQKRICEEWGISRTTLNTIVQEYLKKGYIKLLPAEHKEKEIVLTDEGKAYVEKYLTSVFGAEEKAIVPFLETTLVENMEEFKVLLEKEFLKIKNVE